MLVVSEPKDLLGHINHNLGYGGWILIDQKKINEFALISGDYQWIHVDTDRAVNEMPDGNVLKIEQLKQSINYGIDKVRFTSPVKVGTKIRMNSVIEDVTERDNGVIYLKIKRVVEMEDGERPAMVASTISLLYPKK